MVCETKSLNECRGVNQQGRSQCLQHFEDYSYSVRWGESLVYRRKSFGTYGVFQMACTVDCEMQPSGLFDYKLGFVSENTFFYFPLGFLLQRKHVFFQTCSFLKQ